MVLQYRRVFNTTRPTLPLLRNIVPTLPGPIVPVGLAAYLRVLLVCSRLLVSRFLALQSSSLHVLLLSLLPPLVVVVVVNTPCYPRVVSLPLLPPLVHLFIPISVRSICAINLSSASSCALRPSYHHPQSKKVGVSNLPAAIYRIILPVRPHPARFSRNNIYRFLSCRLSLPPNNRFSHSCRQGTLLPLLSPISTSRNCTTVLTSPHSSNTYQPFSNLYSQTVASLATFNQPKGSYRSTKARQPWRVNIQSCSLHRREACSKHNDTRRYPPP